MFKPDYEGGSIANLVASIVQACGGAPLQSTLRDHDNTPWAETEHLALLVLDGLGWDILHTYGAGSFLARHINRRLTSVFPSTTAAAISTFMSGLTPLQHAMTGWFVWLKELGCASAILPFVPRWEWRPFSAAGVDSRDVYRFDPLFPQIPRECYIIQPSSYKGSEYSNHTGRGGVWRGYTRLQGFTRQISRAVAEAKGPSYIYAYWPVYDSTSHKFGSYSEEVQQHFNELDKAIERLADNLAGKGVRLLVTADHGFCNATPETRVRVEDHPDLAACLNIPLVGEPRVPYAYVKPAMAQRFEELVAKLFGDKCRLLTRQQALDEGWYGRGEPNPAWADRVGDYILLLEKGWVLTNGVLHENTPAFIGYHGGPSDTEMHVPLIEIIT